MAGDNLETVKAIYAAMGRADMKTVFGHLASDVEWIESEGFAYGGTYRGADEIVKGVFMRLGTEWKGFATQVEEFVDGGDQVVALGWYTGTFKATGKPMRARVAHVWSFQGGKVARFRQYVDSVKANEAMTA